MNEQDYIQVLMAAHEDRLRAEATLLNAVYDALDAGYPRTGIAAASGYSRAHIYNIIEARRSA